MTFTKQPALTDEVLLSAFPSVAKTNARLIKTLWIVGIPGLILPFVLPESRWLADSFLFQQLGLLIPSAQKLANVAQFPAVVFVYTIAMLTMAFVLGVGNFILVDSHHEYLRYSLKKNSPHGRWNLWFKALLGIFFCAALLAFFYIFPGQPTGNPQGSRGQLIVSLIVMTKPGLAVLGNMAAAGAFVFWFTWPTMIFNTFTIPFLSSTTLERSNHE